MSDLSRVPCARCGEALRVWTEGGRFYVGCPYKGCGAIALPRKADDAINLAWHGPTYVPPEPEGKEKP